jgi:hypothetical protein
MFNCRDILETKSSLLNGVDAWLDFDSEIFEIPSQLRTGWVDGNYLFTHCWVLGERELTLGKVLLDLLETLSGPLFEEKRPDDSLEESDLIVRRR